ncbi:hypothetical protein AMELA_G00189540 [Ameiurus melas]|uniref:Uncharacterized protein n=1 Tax=Ameiurus melas TaxID=219545 RepID=A0A7J6ACF0_AMEME|nr:hypothetical protein AMELA_G00189540 [Ameiurus melas]
MTNTRQLKDLPKIRTTDQEFGRVTGDGFKFFIESCGTRVRICFHLFSNTVTLHCGPSVCLLYLEKSKRFKAVSSHNHCPDCRVE